MRVVYSIFFLIISNLFLYQAKAQQVEIGLMLGASNYLGDLSNESFVSSENHISGSLFGRYNINPRWAVKGFVGYGRVSGDDKNFKNNPFNVKRNLNFYSDIYEFSGQFEVNLIKNDLVNYGRRPFLPYVFFGLGIFNFNPKTKLGGTTYELQPLGTEGQGTTTYNETKKYSLTSVCIPIGFGFRQKIGEAFFLGIEGGIRFTRTNYLDDVGGAYANPSVVAGAYGPTAGLLSDRSWETVPLTSTGQPDYQFKEDDPRSVRDKFRNDMYYMVGVTFTYVIRTKGQGCPTF